MSEVQFPDGSRHAFGRPEPARQLGTTPIEPLEQPSAAWPDEAACRVAAAAHQSVDVLATRAQAAGLNDVQQAAEDAVSALGHLDRVLRDHHTQVPRSGGAQ